ncbi:MAG: DUF4292 domain-containing protein [Bacteroidetes bacterium]|nr:DUF4292 domain-containing protein [Bacteroidota bacterium]
MNKLNLQKNFLLILIITLIVSCKPEKQLSVQKEIIPQTIVNKEITTDTIFDKMSKSQFRFDWLSAKFSAEYEVDNNNTSFSGQIRIRKDSLIWISISKYSIEIARLLITEDSVHFVNWMDNNYFISDFNYINRFINNAVDFDMLQAFFVGNDFKYYETDKFKTNFDGTQYHLSTVNRHKLKKYIKTENDKLKILVQSIFVDPFTFKISELSVKEVKANNKLKASYSNHEAINGQLFPRKLSVLISAEKEIKINIEFSKINIDEPLNFPFRIPGSYERIIPK